MIDGYPCGVSVDGEAGVISRGSAEDVARALYGWMGEGGSISVQWTVEAGFAPEFLSDPCLAAYLETKVNLAVFCQRKTDAMKIEARSVAESSSTEP
jgi:hypothetical protein